MIGGCRSLELARERIFERERRRLLIVLCEHGRRRCLLELARCLLELEAVHRLSLEYSGDAAPTKGTQ